MEVNKTVAEKIQEDKDNLITGPSRKGKEAAG
jgi:hypothetical protein